ncbi:MAG: hypothetical protein ACK57K_11995, partial [Chryseotalea sp.]
MNKQFWFRSFIAASVLLVVDLIFSPTEPNGYSLENAFWETGTLMVCSNVNHLLSLFVINSFPFEVKEKIITNASPNGSKKIKRGG